METGEVGHRKGGSEREGDRKRRNRRKGEGEREDVYVCTLPPPPGAREAHVETRKMRRNRMIGRADH